MSSARSGQRRAPRVWRPILAVGAAGLIGAFAGCDGAEATDPGVPDGATSDPRLDAGADCVPQDGWVDLDADGWGDSAQPRPWCGDRPTGVAPRSGDCDDDAPEVHPGVIERCDGVDEDCDGSIDERVESRQWYVDADGDGFGDEGVSLSDCAPPPGFTDAAGDCDDQRADVYPEAAEMCDAIDQDCDGAIDEGVLGLGASPMELGSLEDDPRSVALASDGDDHVVVWIDELRAIRAQRLDAAGGPVGPARVVAESVPDVPALPVARVVSTDEGQRLFVLFRDGGAIFARSMDLDSGALAPARPLGESGNPRPVALLELGGIVAAVWTRPTGVWLQELSPSDGGLLGAPVEIAEVDATATNSIGASAAVLDTEGGALVLAVVDREPFGPARHAYVHRIDLRPSIVTDEHPGLFELPEGAAPRTVQVVVDPELDPTTPSALLFVGWGTAPDVRTQVFRFVPSNPGALGTVSPLGQPWPGLALGAALAPGGADWWAIEGAPSDRDAIRVRHQPLAQDAGDSVGSVAPLMPQPTAALAERRGPEGLLVYGGRISPTDVTGGLWAVPLGCAR